MEKDIIHIYDTKLSPEGLARIQAEDADAAPPGGEGSNEEDGEKGKMGGSEAPGTQMTEDRSNKQTKKLTMRSSVPAMYQSGQFRDFCFILCTSLRVP